MLLQKKDKNFIDKFKPKLNKTCITHIHTHACAHAHTLKWKQTCIHTYIHTYIYIFQGRSSTLPYILV